MRNNLLTYTHNGLETTHDEFQFSLKDGNGVLARDGAFTSFNFNFNITPVNDPPVTRDSSFTFSYAFPITRTLVAKDPDNASLTFSIVTNPTKGTISGFNATTGQFTYTPTFGSPTTDSFTYTAFDGALLSNVSTITLNQVNLPPVASNVTRSGLEDLVITGTLTATDPEGSFPLTFQKIKSPSKGTATVLTFGNYTYTPNPSTFGGDYFTFKASDAQGNLSLEDTVFIRIVPRLDPGDILVVDQNALRLFDPVSHRDTILSKNQGLTQGLNVAYKPGTSVFAFDKLTGVLKINPLSGNQTLVAARGGFSAGGPIGGAPGMLIDNAGKLIVADGTSILKVDTTSGAITTLFTGGLLQYATGVTYLNNGDLIVSDAGFMAGGSSKVIRITPAGVQTLVSSNATIKVPLDIAVIDQNTVVMCDAGSFGGGADNVYKINLTTGALTVISTGGSIAIPTGLDYSQNKLYVVNNSGTKKLLDIDVPTGVQTILPGSAFTQPWGVAIVPSGIPAAKIVQNAVVASGQSVCYNATQTITVAGGGTTFIVQNGGSTTMIAGLKILYQPGTNVNLGGYMLGYIAAGGPYCYTPSLPAVIASEEEIPFISAQSLFKIYPNPTSGNFILEQKGDREFRSGKIEVYGMRGEKVMKTIMNGERRHEFMFADMPTGLYFIKVIADDEVETFKLIKTR